MSVYGWWFAEADDQDRVFLPHGDNRQVIVEETLTVEPARVLPCVYGLHASARVIDALAYAPGSVLSFVRLDGTIVDAEDKWAASERTPLIMRDVSSVLHHFACDVAERALKQERLQGREPHPSSWAAIDAKRACLRNDIDVFQLRTARSAAEYAARSAAESAAWSAGICNRS